ncbi:hypothetical protein AMAG_00038 [Allomyces macrogynus ATCC 38327]|uniref:Enoyl-CoA hydratase/isomerase n=1 Tax=Allomyces macrogynus (strain ATCC 38327) TaxID=578462 RepID=A0A0L0RVD8_ALLM3|nr:hypothetical protein AMAG_00038 [Allomyces macrogynus ATCC 38327]|eukprot:KNE54035.1 hypothetical protein AMAG_00038 [Allomyces macrogynus ATCC 38327]
MIRSLATTSLRAATAGAAPSTTRFAAIRAAPTAFRFASTSTPAVTNAAREAYIEKLAGADTGITILSLNRPKAKNALSRQLLAEFRECLDAVRFDADTRVLVVRSLVDRVFCAGADLKERATMNPTEVAAFVSSLRAAFSELEALPMPTIAAIDGAALGGGLEMALCCDLRVAGPGAKLGLPETKLAIIPGAGGTQRLPRLIGPAKAKELIFTGRVLSPADALAIGVVSRTADDSAVPGALALAREIVPQGPIAVRMAKLAVDRGSQVDLASGLAFEQTCYAQVIPTEDRLEGLKAFAEKRTPQYRGQ